MTGVKDLAEQTLVSLLDTINKGLDTAPQYVVDLIHRYGVYFGVSRLIGAVIALTVSIILIWFGRKLIKEGEHDSGQGAILLSLFIIVIFITLIIVGVKGFIIPEIALLDHFSGGCK